MMYRCPNVRTIYGTGFCLLVLLLFQGRAAGQMPETVDPHAPGENLYKHFTGMVGNRKAVLDLRYGFQGASNFGGSTCYFPEEGGLKFFRISQPPTFLHTEVLRAQVFPEHIPLKDIKDVYSIFVQTSRFEFTLSHDSLNGKWYDVNANGPLIVTMTEDNRSALPFDFRYATDSVVATGKQGETLKAVATYNGVQPSPGMKEKDAQFIHKALAQFMGGGKKAGEGNDLARVVFQSFFQGFNSAVHDGETLDGSSFSGIYTLFPVYNEHELLVLQVGGYHYDFGNKEYTDQDRYLCLDVKNRKTLKPEDLLEPQKEALAALLEKTFRKKYDLEPGKKLADLFATDTMPLTDNIIPVDKGLLFSYYPAKIFKDSEDISELAEMRLFVPYEELQSMLKPDFKNRMGLK